MDRPLLTPEEHELIAEAERQAVAGMTFDAVAGLADLRRRARQGTPGRSPRSGTAAACRRAVPKPRLAERAASGNRLRPAALAFAGAVTAVVLGFGAVTGDRTEDHGSLDRLTPRATATSATATSPSPRGGGPHTSPIRALTGEPGTPATTATRSPATTTTRIPATTATATRAPGMKSTPAATRTRAAAPVPTKAPAATWDDDASASEWLTTAAAASPTPPAGPAAASFQPLYQPTEVTVPIVDSQSRPIDLVRPHLKIAGDGDVRIGSEDAGLYLYAGDNVQTATVTGGSATAAQCADAIQDNPSGPNVELHEDETYCLLASNAALPGPALVRLNLEPPDATGKVTLTMAAWDTVP